MLTHRNSVTGVPVRHYCIFHPDRSAVSSTKISQRLAPPDFSLSRRNIMFTGPHLRVYIWKYTIPHAVCQESLAFFKKIFTNLFTISVFSPPSKGGRRLPQTPIRGGSFSPQRLPSFVFSENFFSSVFSSHSLVKVYKPYLLA